MNEEQGTFLLLFLGWAGTVPDSKLMALTSNVPHSSPRTHTHTHNTESKALTQGPMQIDAVSMGTETPVCFPSPVLCNFQQGLCDSLITSQLATLPYSLGRVHHRPLSRAVEVTPRLTSP